MNYESIQKSAGEYQIYVEVSEFETRHDVIYFKIELYSFISGKEWEIAHRFNDFYELHLILAKFYFKIPPLPGKTLGKVHSVFELNKRKEALTEFLRELVKRPDLISSIYVVKFLKLENHFPDVGLFQPLMLYNLEQLPYPVSTFHFTQTSNLLFVGLTNPSLNGKLNSIFSKIKMLSTTTNLDNIGGLLLIYNIIKNHSGASHFELLYERELVSGVSSINFYETKNVLLVGLQNGDLNTYKVFINESSGETRELIEDIGIVKSHKKRLVGASVNFTLGYIYSVARDTKIKISEMNYQSLMKDVPLTKKEISAMVYDEVWERMIIADDAGSIWIVDIMTNPLQPRVLQALHNQIPNITCLQLELDRSLLLIGNKGGMIVTYHLENYKEKIVPQSFLPNTSSIVIRKKNELRVDPHLKINGLKLTGRNELLVLMSNGSVAVFAHEKENPEYVLDAHLENAVAMHWDEQKKVILTGSADKSVKMFQFPVFWPGEMMRKTKEKNSLRPIEESNTDDGIIRGETNIATVDDILLSEMLEKEKFCEDLDGWDELENNIGQREVL